MTSGNTVKGPASYFPSIEQKYGRPIAECDPEPIRCPPRLARPRRRLSHTALPEQAEHRAWADVPRPPRVHRRAARRDQQLGHQLPSPPGGRHPRTWADGARVHAGADAVQPAPSRT
ncbi:hypothetical protein SFUMM280S_03905 [Streptomyces fumanus]